MKDRAARTVRLAPPQHASCDASKSTGERSITPDTHSLSLCVRETLYKTASLEPKEGGGCVAGGQATMSVGLQHSSSQDATLL